MYPKVAGRVGRFALLTANLVIAVVVAWLLTLDWMPLGLDRSSAINFIFVFLIIGGLLVAFRGFEMAYGKVLQWCLRHKAMFLSLPVVLLVLAGSIWLGFDKIFSWLPKTVGAARIPKAEEMIMTQIIWLKIPSVDIDAARWLLIAATKSDKPIIRINEGISTSFSEL